MKRIICNRKLLLLLYFITTVFVFIACENPNPEGELTSEEQDIYITNYDTSATFSQYRTFSIVDSIGTPSDDQTAMIRVLTDDDATVLNVIVDQLEARGYIRVDNTENPDIGIDVSRIILSETGVGTINYGYDYWGYPGYSYYYPSYYYTYEINTGALRIDIIDLKDRLTPQSNLKIVWNGFIIGAVGQQLPPLSRILPGIESLFQQSPYLNASSNE